MKKSLILLFIIITTLILSMVILIDYKFKTSSDDNAYKEETKIDKLEYRISSYQKDETTNFDFPDFTNEEIKSSVTTYLEKNNCTYLNYDLYKMSEDTVNIYLDCGIKEDFIYNTEQGKSNIFSYVVNVDKFKEKITELLKLKYPTFVVEQVNIENAKYDIKNNEIVMYQETKDFGDISLKINNNELKDQLKYSVIYDEKYENEQYKLDKNKKTVAFTFDDGPSSYDPSIVKALTDAHYTATFYMVGNRINNFKTAVNTVVNANMEVGNHTYDHKSLNSLSGTKVQEELTSSNNVYNKLTGKNMTSLRPPYGNANSNVLQNANTPVIIWSLDTSDWSSRNADKVYDKIMSNIKDGDIVLMHSLYPSTLQAVQRVIPELYKQGYQIVSVKELAEIKGVTLQNNHKYFSIK